MSLNYEPVEPKKIQPRQNRPGTFGTITIPGTTIGAIVSVGLVVICWFALPLSRPFIIGTGALGLLLGLFLYWRHRDPHE